VLVKKSASQPQSIGVTYPVGAGAPVMVLGGGSHGGGSRGRTLREQAGGTLGGLVGVAGALTGQHRNLGSLVQSMISGGAQGRQLGSALGRKFVGREGQAAADLREEMADKYARARASGEFDKYGISAGRTPFTNIGVMLTEQGGDSMMGRRLAELQRAKEAEKNTMAEERERAMADAKAFGADEGGRRRQMAEDLANFIKVTGMDPARASEFMSKFGQRINAMQEQQASSQGQDDAVVNPNQGDPVDPVQQATNQMQELPITQRFLPPSKGAEDASAYAEIVDIEDQSTSANDKILQERLASMRPSEQDEEENPTQSSVRSPNQSRLGDFKE